MSYFAKIDSSNIVADVTVADQEFINTGVMGDPSIWIETNMASGIRKQYAQIGFTYDAVNDVFISPKPYPSWSLDTNFDWQAPTAMPVDDKMYEWNETTTTWDEIE